MFTHRREFFYLFFKRSIFYTFLQIRHIFIQRLNIKKEHQIFHYQRTQDNALNDPRWANKKRNTHRRCADHQNPHLRLFSQRTLLIKLFQMILINFGADKPTMQTLGTTRKAEQSTQQKTVPGKPGKIMPAIPMPRKIKPKSA